MKEYEKTGHLSSCRLISDDLSRLEGIFRDNAPGEPSVLKEFAAVAYRSDGIISERSIEDLWAHPEIPKTMNRLRMQFTDHGAGEIDLTFNRDDVFLKVSGITEFWVLGKFAQIAEFLKKNRPWYWPIIDYGPLVFVLWFVTFFVSLAFVDEPNSSIGRITNVVTFVILMVGLLLFGLRSHLPSTLLDRARISTQASAKSERAQDTIGLVIAMLIFLASVVGDVILLTK